MLAGYSRMTLLMSKNTSYVLVASETEIITNIIRYHKL